MKQKKFKFSGDLLTFILVAAVYAVVAYLLYGGSLTRQFSNMIIPISVYIVLAVSLNLVVGLLGELSLGHAGFMSVGLFSGCLLQRITHTVHSIKEQGKATDQTKNHFHILVHFSFLSCYYIRSTFSYTIIEDRNQIYVSACVK